MAVTWEVFLKVIGNQGKVGESYCNQSGTTQVNPEDPG